ncbi:hypothetical protein [Dietzia lutea]|uniref:Uncharacterized protein n=1 Tax=Dietzia lutea TaxID=546160 RepID=A0A2S1R898_9ACTN|nr:hypothetical protein [Dietzia lutea]AWH92502.1 hypothetical protein A6035_10375 [Dietzia lutea]
MHTAPEPEPDESLTTSRRWRLPRRGDYVRDATLWWDDWVPVAATGWGAVVLIAPLLAAEVLIRAVGSALSTSRPASGPHGSDDLA